MIIPVENGHGKTVGCVRASEQDLLSGFIRLEWVYQRRYRGYSSLERKSVANWMIIKISRRNNGGRFIRLRWKERERLKRSGKMMGLPNES